MAPTTDWYETHKKNVAAALKKAKAAPKAEAVLCALVKNKDNSHVLCAGIAKPKMVMDAKKAGGKVVSDGVVFSDGGNPTFEVSEGDVSVAVKFAAAAAEVLGSPMKVAVVKASAAPPPAPSAPGGAGASAAPATPAPGGAAANAAPASGARAPNAPPVPPPAGNAPVAPGGAVPNAPPPPGTRPPNAPPAPGGAVPNAPPAPPPPGAPAGNAPPAPPPPGATAANSQAPASAVGADEAKFNDRLKQLLPAVIEAQKAKSSNAGELKLAASEAQTLGRKKDFAQANALLDKVQALLKPPAPVTPAGAGDGKPPAPPATDGGSDGKPAAPATPAGGGDGKNPGLALWTQERTKVVNSLKVAAKEVDKTKLPDSQKAAIRLLAVAKNLTAAPTTVQQVTSLEKWLDADPIVAMAENFPKGKFSIRQPLLKALAEIRKHLPE